MNLIVISNDNFPVKIEGRDDRCYVVTKTSSTRVKDHAYFDKLFSLQNPQFYENLFRFFAQRNISNWKRKVLPMTEAKKDITEASQSSYKTFISYHKSKFMEKDEWCADVAHETYNTWAKDHEYKPCTPTKFGIEMRKYCSKDDKKRQGKVKRYYKLLPEYEKQFEEMEGEDDTDF